MGEQKPEKKIPLWLAISGLIIIAGGLFAIVALILYQMDYRRRAETARTIAAQIYEDAVVPEGVVLLHQEQNYNPFVNLTADTIGCVVSVVTAVYGTNRPEEEIIDAYIYHFVEEEEYHQTNWSQSSLYKGTRRSIHIIFDSHFLPPLSPEMELVANDMELLYTLSVAYSIQPGFNPDVKCYGRK